MDRTLVILLIACIFLGVVFGVPKGAAYNALVNAGALMFVLVVYWGAKYLFGYLKRLYEHNFDIPAEVQQCLEELKILEPKLDNTSFPLIKPQITKLIKDKEKTIYSVRESKMSPRHLVLLLISNVSGEYLATGQYHIYRGRLSMEGQELLKLFNYAISEMEKNGFQSKEETEKDRIWIREQINSVG